MIFELMNDTGGPGDGVPLVLSLLVIDWADVAERMDDRRALDVRE
jgi:hypothetical protein